MKISLETHASGFLIQGYAQGEIRVRKPAAGGAELVTHRHSLVVMPDQLLEWEPHSFEELARAHLEELAGLGPEVILLGSGPRMLLPSTPLLGVLASLGIGFEVMDTGAACRTYNLLAGEGRRVAAALLIG
jgi:uncharacterized protein